MRFTTLLLSTLLTALTTAQNPFTFTTLTSITAGTPFNITWAPSTGTVDTVTLVLRQGDPSALKTVLTIASKIQNTGSYLWTPPTTLVQGSQYAFEIVDDGNDAIVNYSNQFSIASTNTVSSVVVSSTATTSGASSMTSETGKTSNTGSVTSKTTTTSGGETGSSASQTGTQTSTGTGTSSGSAAATTTKSGAAGVVHAGVGAGLLGVVGGLMVLL